MDETAASGERGSLSDPQKGVICSTQGGHLLSNRGSLSDPPTKERSNEEGKGGRKSPLPVPNVGDDAPNATSEEIGYLEAKRYLRVALPDWGRQLIHEAPAELDTKEARTIWAYKQHMKRVS